VRIVKGWLTWLLARRAKESAVKKLLAFSIAVALLLAWTTRLFAEDKPGAETPYYPIKVGSVWTYKFSNSEQRLTMRIVRHDKVGDLMCAVIEASAGGQVQASEYVAVKADGVYRVKGSRGEAVMPPFPFLKLPPKKGETWTIMSKADKLDIKGKATIDDDAKEIQVPAGKYKAVVVTNDLEVGNQRVSTTYYFASGVGMIKQIAKIQGMEMGFELEKYEEGK
jgi:uncharacterized protein YdaL